MLGRVLEESEGGPAGMDRHASGVDAIRALGPDEVVEPRVVGELVAQGISANAPYICPHPKNRTQVVERFGRILDAFSASSPQQH